MAERMNRALTERAGTILNHMHVEKKWWAEAINTAVYVTNRIKCAGSPTKTPFELCFGTKPNLSHMQVFGAQGFGYVSKAKRHKMDKKSFRCMFLGYAHDGKRYRAWNYDSQRLEITRSMIFQELTKSQYVQVVFDSQFTPCTHHNQDDDDGMERSPVIHARSEEEPMVVDQTGSDQTISHPSELGCLSPSQDFVHASQPMFGNNDVGMEPTVLDMDTSMDSVPRKGGGFLQVREHNALLEAPWSNNS